MHFSLWFLTIACNCLPLIVCFTVYTVIRCADKVWSKLNWPTTTLRARLSWSQPARLYSNESIMQVDYFNIFPLITHNVQGHISHTHMYLILPIRQITFETFTRSISNLPIDCLYMFASSCVCHKNFHLKKKKKELPLVLSVRLKHGLVHFTRKKKKDSVLFSCAKFLSRSKIDLRPAGGVNHPDSVLAKVGKLPAKRALRWLDGSILSNSRKF